MASRQLAGATVALLAALAAFACACAGLIGIEDTTDESPDGSTPNGEGGGPTDGPGPSDNDGGGGTDGGVDSPTTDGETDAGVDAKPPDCDLTKPFGTVTAIGGVNTSSYETGGRLSNDGLTLYFTRASATAQVFKATRGQPSGAFSNVGGMADINSGSADGYLTLPTTETSAYFASNRSPSQLLDIWRMTRAMPSGAFSGATRLTALASTSDDDDPFVRADGRAIYFDSKRSGMTDIYRADIDVNGTVGSPSLVANVSTTGAIETNPVVTADELTIYFAFGPNGSQQIRKGTRANTSASFSNIGAVAELNSASDDRPTWVSPDGCKIILSSERANGQGSSDLYYAEKPK